MINFIQYNNTLYYLEHSIIYVHKTGNLEDKPDYIYNTTTDRIIIDTNCYLPYLYLELDNLKLIAKMFSNNNKP